MRELGMHAYRERDMRGHRDKAAVFKPRREASRENSFVNTLILNFQPPEL
jgi:hypothetical protein